MSASQGIQTVQELYAHAMALEREAAERYAEFAQHMADEGNGAVAAIFQRLAALEGEHLQALRSRTDATQIPGVDEQGYRWLDEGAPNMAAHELLFRLMTPRQAIAIALDAERRARAFFEQATRSAPDPSLRALAQQMAAEENEHIAMLLDLMQHTVDPVVDWAAHFEAEPKDR